MQGINHVGVRSVIDLHGMVVLNCAFRHCLEISGNGLLRWLFFAVVSWAT